MVSNGHFILSYKVRNNGFLQWQSMYDREVFSMTSARVGIKTICTSTVLHVLCVFMTGWGWGKGRGLQLKVDSRYHASSRLLLIFPFGKVYHLALCQEIIFQRGIAAYFFFF